MEDLVNSAGQKGISAIIERVENDYKLRLQFRIGSIAQIKCLWPALQALPMQNREEIGSLGLEWQVGIRYCPWCGTNLIQWISDYSSVISELAEQHKSLVL